MKALHPRYGFLDLQKQNPNHAKIKFGVVVECQRDGNIPCGKCVLRNRCMFFSKDVNAVVAHHRNIYLDDDSDARQPHEILNNDDFKLLCDYLGVEITTTPEKRAVTKKEI